MAIAVGFVYFYIGYQECESRRIVGYAVSRSLDTRIAVWALRSAIELRRPRPGCVFHSDRGSQYTSAKHRALLAEHGFVGL